MPGPDTNLLVVVNASAGSARKGEVGTAMAVLRTAADMVGASVELAETADLNALADALDGLADRRLIVLGGDGSLHAAVQRLHETGRLRAAGPIAVVPLGTGNDLATSLGIPTSPAEAARVAMTGQPQDMELLVADDAQVTVNAVHLGIGATAARRGAAVKRWLGRFGLSRLGYPIGAVAAGLTEKGWRLRVSVDGEPLDDGEQPLLMVAMGLGGTIGGGALLVPAADPHDGAVDVVVSSAVGPLARLGYALQVRDGRHVHRHDVRTRRGRIIDVLATAGESFHVNSDGELSGPYSSRRWEIERDAWQVITPT